MSVIRILSIDSGSTAASAAIVEDGKILAEFFLNTKLTHSQTLMPMIKMVLDITNTQIPDLITVTAGPGSFTGVRIGIASAKGLAMPNKIPCVGVSSLEALAYNLKGFMENKTICAVMDARCGQVYNALFSLNNGIITRICDDRTIMISDLYEQAKQYGSSLLLVGDCAEICHDTFKTFEAQIVPENNRYHKASSVAFVGIEKKWGTAAELQPIYLQLPQAQRELNKRMDKKE